MKDLSSKQVSLKTLAGVENVHLDGDSIAGRWKREQGFIVSNKPQQRSVAEDFVNVNSEDPKEILRFTSKYGPLSKSLEQGGSEFRQSIEEWRSYQGWVRQRLWGQSFGYGIGMEEGEQVHFDRKGRVCAIVLSSLKRLLEFEIFSTPYALRRICERPGCGTYFIARRKDSRLCGTPLCADEVRKKQMRKWWTEHGEEWRKRRKKKLKKRPKV